MNLSLPQNLGFVGGAGRVWPELPTKSQLNSIKRKANRFARRFNDRRPAKFAAFDYQNKGNFLMNLDDSPNLLR